MSLLAALNGAEWGGEKARTEGRSFLTLTVCERGTAVLRFDGRDARSDMALGRTVTSELLTKILQLLLRVPLHPPPPDLWQA